MDKWPVVMPVRGGLDQCRKAIDSVLAQSVDVELFVVNNSVLEDLALTACLADLEAKDKRVYVSAHVPALSVSASWNSWLCPLFGLDADWALVINSDVELHKDTYVSLVKTGQDFVTGVGISPVEPEVPAPDLGRPLTTHPDFSCFLIRKGVFLRVGLFDEAFRPAYMEDWDYHRRMTLAGIRALKADVPFWHRSCGTSKENPTVRTELGYREVTNPYYVSKWGRAWPDETFNVPFMGVL